MADHTNYFQHPAGIDVEDESALAAAERAEVAADSAEASATAAAASATESNTWKDLSKAWAIQLVTQVDEGAGPVDYSSKHYATVVAAGHATDAGNSAAAAAATLVAFEQAYLGTKLSDPALDNEGQALIEGAVYWNSTNKILRLYNGTSWQDWDPVQLVISDWALATNYTVGTAVIGSDGILYVADSTHISSNVDFATDLAAGLWRDVHPASGGSGTSTLIQFSPDGEVWYEEYQDGWTWARQREVVPTIATWPESLSEIASPQQDVAMNGHRGSASTVDLSGTNNLKNFTFQNQAYDRLFFGPNLATDRKAYFEIVHDRDLSAWGVSTFNNLAFFVSNTQDSAINYALGHDGTNYRYFKDAATTASTSTATSATVGAQQDIIGIAVSPVERRCWFAVNGVWVGANDDPANGVGGFLFDADTIEDGGVAFGVMSGQGGLTHRIIFPDDLTYLPPAGFPPHGNPTLSGFLSEETVDTMSDETVLLYNFDGLQSVSSETLTTEHWKALVDKSKYKHTGWSYGGGPKAIGINKYEPAPSGGDSLLTSEEYFGAVIPFSPKLHIDEGEDFTFEIVFKGTLYNGNREFKLFQFGGTGQRNGPQSDTFGVLSGLYQSRPEGQDSGLILYGTDPAVDNSTKSVILNGTGPDYAPAELWHHFIVEREAGTLRIIHNGVEAASLTGGVANQEFGFSKQALDNGFTTSTGPGADMFILGNCDAVLGATEFRGSFDQVRITKGAVRYGLNNWPTQLPSTFPATVVTALDESNWKVFRIGDQAVTEDGLRMEFSNGNGDWHGGFENGDVLGRIVAGARSSSKVVTPEFTTVSAGYKVVNSDVFYDSTSTTFRNVYSDLTLESGKYYFEVFHQSIENQSTDKVGLIGINRKISDATPDVAAYGGFSWNAAGAVLASSVGGNEGWSVGSLVGFAVDVDAGVVWPRVNGHWFLGEPYDYDNAWTMYGGSTEDYKEQGGLTILLEGYGGRNPDFTDGPVELPLWVIPESPIYEIPTGFVGIGKTLSESSLNNEEVIGTFPVGAAQTGTQIEFSSDGTSWSENYAEGMTFARIPRESANAEAGSSWSAKDSFWNAGIFEGASKSGGGLLLTADGYHTTGKHYWEVEFTRSGTVPNGQIGTDVVPYPYYDGQVAWIGNTVGAGIGVAGPVKEGVNDPDRIKSGGRYYQTDLRMFTVESVDTYSFINKMDRYARNGTLVPGYGMQYNGPSRGAGTDYTPIRWGEVWGLAVDVDAGLYWAREDDGTWLPSGDPASGTGGWSIPAQDYRFICDFRAAESQGSLVALRSGSKNGVPAGFTFYNSASGTADPLVSESTLYCSFETDDQDESPNAWSMSAVTAAQSGAATLGQGNGGLDMGTTAGQRLSYLKTPTNVAFDIGASDKLVFKCKFQGVGTAGRAFQWLFGSDNGLPATTGFGVQVAETGGAIYVFYNGSLIFNGVTEGAFTDERELLIERNSVGLFRMYVNGVYKTQASNTNATTCNAFYVGSAGGTFPGDNGDWNGYIDDVFFATDTTVQCPFAGNDNNDYTVDPVPLGTNQPPVSSRFKEWRMGGAEQLFGTAAPASGDGKVGDVFTDTTNKNVYQKTDASTWTLRYTYT